MIGSLRGRVARVSDSEMVLEVGGVGYRVSATPSTIATASMGADDVLISVHTHVREDAIVLFGFSDDAEREIFEVLLGTHGVGPSLALGIVGSLGALEVVRAVRDGDTAAFESVSGVGKKTAARLILELQGKISGMPLLATDVATTVDGPVRAEVAAALAELGYAAEEIRSALSEVASGGDVQETLRRALRELSRS